MNTNKTRRIWPGSDAQAHTRKGGRMTTSQLADKVAKLERELAQARQAQASQPSTVEVPSGRKAQAGAKHVVVKGFTYQGSTPDKRLGAFEPQKRRHFEYVLAGYGLAYNPAMTHAEYAQACAEAKASGRKWAFVRPTAAMDKAAKAGPARTQAQAARKPQSQAKAEPVGKKAEAAQVLAALGRLLGL